MASLSGAIAAIDGIEGESESADEFDRPLPLPPWMLEADELVSQMHPCHSHMHTRTSARTCTLTHTHVHSLVRGHMQESAEGSEVPEVRSHLTALEKDELRRKIRENVAWQGAKKDTVVAGVPFSRFDICRHHWLRVWSVV